MEKEIIHLKDADLAYFSNFCSKGEADFLLNYLQELPNWKQDKIWLFGKEVLQPRLTALFGEQAYKYSGLKMSPIPIPEELKEIKDRCEKYCQEKFNVCLANLYRDGSDSMGWHADDEKELGSHPVIASVSFGAERIFHLKHKTIKAAKHKIRLQHGSLLVMRESTQKFWKHQLPKTKMKIDPRINLTFRKVY